MKSLLYHKVYLPRTYYYLNEHIPQDIVDCILEYVIDTSMSAFPIPDDVKDFLWEDELPEKDYIIRHNHVVLRYQQEPEAGVIQTLMRSIRCDNGIRFTYAPKDLILLGKIGIKTGVIQWVIQLVSYFQRYSKHKQLSRYLHYIKNNSKNFLEIIQSISTKNRMNGKYDRYIFPELSVCKI